MDISFSCKCGQHIVIDEAGGGTVVNCPNCQTPLKVPDKASLKAPTPPLPVTDTKKCPYCAEVIKNEAVVCRFCGRDLAERQTTEQPPLSDLVQREMLYEMRRKTPELAAVLSLFIPGAGQIYSGKYFFGVVCLIFIPVMLQVSGLVQSLWPIGVYWLVIMADAWWDTRKRNREIMAELGLPTK